MSTVKEWDLETGKEVRVLFAHPNVNVSKFVGGAFRRLALAPDARHLAALIEPEPFSSKVKGAAGKKEDRIKVWDLDTGKEVCTVTGLAGSIGSIEFSVDGKSLTRPGNNLFALAGLPRKS